MTVPASDRLLRFTRRAYHAVRSILRQMSWSLRRGLAPAERRYSYQQPAIRHRFRPGESVLDIGSGGDPFPHATVLADRYLEPSRHRAAEFVSEHKPVVICDISAMPFREKTFDYVVCSHVLEHVDQPMAACRELQRVGRAGFIETPVLMKDALFSWAKGMHAWHVVGIGDRLVFFQYDTRTAEGVRSTLWHDMIFSPVYHPLQRVFNDNQDLFNVLFEWSGSFRVTVFRAGGDSESDA
ncbi:MAG TPA: methyltransferase domain-containing protein [Thermoanaerobaculia bacterium]|nr:methyltransferase domain-containing protein [Thermoanaerobaculia bacterium]